MILVVRMQIGSVEAMRFRSPTMGTSDGQGETGKQRGREAGREEGTIQYQLIFCFSVSP